MKYSSFNKNELSWVSKTFVYLLEMNGEENQIFFIQIIGISSDH